MKNIKLFDPMKTEFEKGKNTPWKNPYKKYATMTPGGPSIVIANNKKEAAEKLKVQVKQVFQYN